MAKQIPFTPRSLAALKPAAERYEVREVGRTGLRVRVEPSGVKSFRWHASAIGKVFTLGRFGDGAAGTLTLKEARDQLEVYKTRHGAGLDPEGVPQADRPRTVGDLADVWYRESIMLRRRRPEVVKDVIDRDIKPAAGRVPLAAVDVLTAGRIVSRAVERGARAYAARVLQITKQMFEFGVARGFLQVSPAAALDGADLGVVVNHRDRFLSAEEITILLDAIDTTKTVNAAHRLGLVFLFFTGLRGIEARTLQWTDVDLEAKTVTVRPENQKVPLKKLRSGKVKPYVVPLSGPALAAVKALRELAPEFTPWVFYSPDVQGDGDDRVGRAVFPTALHDVAAATPALARLPRFTPHDFRRTMATHMSETLRLAPWIGQLCLGHSLNRMLGSAVAATYDHATFLPERRDALDTYATWIEGLRTRKTAKVIPLAVEGSR